MNTLYLECYSGISGDMTVAALLDLGADEEALRQGLASLKVEGYDIEISQVHKSGIRACDFDVQLHGEKKHPHTHGKEHSHGDEDHHHGDGHTHRHQGEGRGHHHGDGHTHSHKGEEHAHHHDGEHAHSHGEAHTHSHNGGEHHHRNLADITAIINSSGITPRAKELALRIFQVVAQAEAKVHGLPVEEVHFHEVGAIDSIVDIVGAAILVDNLGIEQVVATPLREGSGTIRCQHGVIPVPAPATLEILRSHGVPLEITDTKGELVTPTGAAIVAALADSFEAPREMRVLRTGYGAGKRDYSHTANLLRASLLTPAAGEGDEVLKLECNLDDMTGEALGYAWEKLLEAGALDVWCTPIYMKKGRPAQLHSLLIPPHREEEFTRLLFLHTSTIGVRATRHRRQVMNRVTGSVETPYGQVAVKEVYWNEICKKEVEYESAKQLAEGSKVPINQIFRSAYSELED